MKEPILKAKQLAVGYSQKDRTRTVVQDLTLSLQRGELVCLIGPNGVGKSTLLRTLAGLQVPLAGEILIEGKNLKMQSATQLAKSISVVFANHSGVNLRVKELVEMGRIPHTGWLGQLRSLDHELVARALQATHLTTFTQRFFEELSDGEKQRVMLARALAQDTPIILLDEPTAHLDIPNKVAMMSLLRELAHMSNKAIVLSTHDLQVALEMADKLWLVSSKGTLEIGLPEELALNGAFEKVFAHEGLEFDQVTGSFKVAQVVTRGKVLVANTLQDTAYLWTTKALVREGFQVVKDEAERKVDVQYKEGRYVWKVTLKGQSKEVYSLGALINMLS